MIEIDLEEIKKRTPGLERYSNYCNCYHWVELQELSSKYKNIPVFDIPKEEAVLNFKRVGGNLSETRWSCFGRYTYHYDNVGGRIIFTIKVKKNIEIKTNNNHCWMSPEMLNYWISTIKEEIGLEFFYKIVDFKQESAIDIYFDFLDLSKIQIQFIIYWIRYIYHYPDSLCALDAIMLKENYLPDETLYNLLILVSNCQAFNQAVHLCGYDCITENGNFVSRGELIWRLHYGNRSIHGIFGNGMICRPKDTLYYKYTKKELPILYKEPGYKIGSHLNTFTPEAWIRNQERFTFYTLEAYPAYKAHEIQV